MSTGAEPWEDPGWETGTRAPARPAAHRPGAPGPAPDPRFRRFVLETRCTELPSRPAQLWRSKFSANCEVPQCPRHSSAPGAGPRPRPGSRAPPRPAPRPAARGRPGRARPYLFQVALAQARRCCVPRSSAAAAAGSLLPRSLRLGELMNFNLRRVLMVTPEPGSAPTRARRRALRHAAPRRGPRPALRPLRGNLGESRKPSGPPGSRPGPTPPPGARHPPALQVNHCS